MLEDQLLILRFKQGQPEALRRIYDKFKVRLLKLAVEMLGDVVEAEDIVHDVFVSFAQSADRLALTGSLKSYLVTSVVNRIRNLRRDRQRRDVRSMKPSDILCHPERDPLDWVIVNERLLALSQALQALPNEQREVICCRMEMGLSFRQIATLQKVSISTVQGRYRYGISKLRNELGIEVET